MVSVDRVGYSTLRRALHCNAPTSWRTNIPSLTTLSRADLPTTNFRELTVRRCSTLTPLKFEKVSEETLESLCEKFEELNELPCCPADFDVTYSAGVLTASIGGGVYLYLPVCAYVYMYIPARTEC